MCHLSAANREILIGGHSLFLWCLMHRWYLFFSLGGLVLMACLDSVYIYIEWKDRGYEVESWAKRYWDIWPRLVMALLICLTALARDETRSIYRQSGSL